MSLKDTLKVSNKAATKFQIKKFQIRMWWSLKNTLKVSNDAAAKFQIKKFQIRIWFFFKGHFSSFK